MGKEKGRFMKKDCLFFTILILLHHPIMEAHLC